MKKKQHLLILFLVLWAAALHGQYKQLLHKSFEENVWDIDTLYENVVVQYSDSISDFAYIAGMKQWALKNQDRELALEAELLRAYYYREHFTKNNKEVLRRLKSVAKKAKKENLIHIEARAVKMIAGHYWWVMKDYQKAFEWYFRLAKVLQTTTSEKFPKMANFLDIIGYCHYYFSDYETAVFYYKKAAVLPETAYNALYILNAKNTLGLCYQKLGLMELSDRSFQSIIKDTSEFSSNIWKGIASGNLGINYYRRKEYKKAVPLLQYNIKEALIYPDSGLAAGAAIPLADIYLQQGKMMESKENLDKALQYIRTSRQFDRLRNLYPVMSKWYAIKNGADSSALYLDLGIAAVEKYHKKYSELKLMRADQEMRAKEKKIQLEALEARSLVKITQRNLAITIISILFGVGLIAYFFRNKYLMQKQELKELSLQNANESLRHARTKLSNLADKIKIDQLLIEQLQTDKGGQSQETADKLKSEVILTGEDWVQYKRLFEQAYPKFLANLKSAYPNLTPGERRYFCLEKLGLSNKEMGAVLGVSFNSIRVTTHRLRKKMNLGNQKDMRELVRGL